MRVGATIFVRPLLRHTLPRRFLPRHSLHRLISTPANRGIAARSGLIISLLCASPQQHLGKFEVSVPMLRKRLFASLDAQYTSAAQTLARNTTSGFSVFNLTLQGHTLGKNADLSASVYNVFNKKYFDAGRPEDPEDAIQQDGRNFRIKLTCRF
jgi:hypothetical protein